MNNSPFVAEPIVSVVMPMYNGERYVAEAIESVLSQSFAQWELLVIDDGCRDRSVEVVMRYAAIRHGQIRCLHHPGRQNRGQSASRNFGIAHARGRYVAFLDQDDVWMPHKLERQVGILEAYPDAAMTYGPSLWWYGWTGQDDDVSRDFIQNLRTVSNKLIAPPTLLELFLREPNATPPPVAIMARRDVIRDIAGFNDDFRSAYEDQIFDAKLTLEFPTFIDDVCLCKHRQHSGSVCGGLTPEDHYRSRLAFLEWLDAYLRERRVKAPTVRATVQKELWPHRHPILHRQQRRCQRLASVARRLFWRYDSCSK